MKKNTIPQDVFCKQGSAKIILKSAAPGKGIIAGGAVRAVVNLAGIKDVVSKSLGTSNKLNVARAAIKALIESGSSLSRKNRLGEKNKIS
jgi:small subunit ribosomal protein S5